MRDPKRIEKVLAVVRDYWLTNPDLRFFQVVEIIKHKLGKDDAFYVEDEEILEAMKF